MKTLIIGANGQIGKKLVHKCVELGMDIRAMVRCEGQLAGFKEVGVEARLGDLEGNISNAFKGCQRVVFAAGSSSKTSPHKTLLVDLWGSIRAIEESEKQEVRHFIMLSSLKADDPMRGPEMIRHYLVARNRADVQLANSGLRYTLLRPGRLTNKTATGKLSNKVDWNDDKNAHCTITRDDVVGTILSILEQPPSTCETLDFINGEVPIKQFLDKHFNRKVVA